MNNNDNKTERAIIFNYNFGYRELCIGLNEVTVLCGVLDESQL